MANVKVIPAPVGGWNTKDALADMPEDTASILDNWFPGEGRCSIRPGYSSYATTLGGDVETLAELISGTARKFIAAANGNLWDISSAGAGVSLGSGYSNNRWDHANMDGKICFVNGADAPKEWDGTTFQNLTISGTGLTVASLIGVNVFSGRSYFWTDNSQDFWYSSINTLGGTLTKFELSRVGQFGGKLVDMGTWTYDSGSGPDDMAVFFMSSGEVIVYQGSNPADFSLIGVFRLAPMVANRGALKFGGDLVVLNRDGYISLAGAIRQGRITERGLLSDQINPSVTEVIADYGSNFGWQAFHYPKGNMLIFNVPISTNQTYQQHVFNTNTGAPTRFRGLPSRCWGLYNDKAYFGGSGVVYLFDDGFDDNGTNIDADALQAPTYLTNKATQKHVTAIQPVLSSDGALAISSDIGVDFKIPNIGYSTTTFTGGQSDWDTATWDVDPWSSADQITNDWLNTEAFGYNFRTRLKVRVKGQGVRWYSINYMFNPGGPV